MNTNVCRQKLLNSKIAYFDNNYVLDYIDFIKASKNRLQTL